MTVSVDLFGNDRKKLFISFSGGRTSAYMTRHLLTMRHLFSDIVVIFANTGKENERTLEFVDRCDRQFGFGTVWVEAVVHPERGKGTTHKIVTFETAARNGEPFERAISKFGVPNKNYPHCTRELKQRPMYSYLRSLGWKQGQFNVAIGIRSDEADRISPSARSDGILYPLVKWKVTKAQILTWWRRQSFDLGLPEHLGNCEFCWKKSRRKHLTLAVDHPEIFDFPQKMEAIYGLHGPGTRKHPRRFFRGDMSTRDLMALASQPFEPFVDGNLNYDFELDAATGCEDSCEVFTGEFMSDLLKLEAVDNA